MWVVALVDSPRPRMYLDEPFSQCKRSRRARWRPAERREPDMRTLLAAVLVASSLASPAHAQEAPVIGTDALAAKMSGAPAAWGFTLVDARTQVEFAESHIPGAFLVPARVVTTKLPELVKDKSRL